MKTPRAELIVRLRVVAMPLSSSPLSLVFRRGASVADAPPAQGGRGRRKAIGDALFLALADVEPAAEAVARFQEENGIGDADVVVMDLATGEMVLETLSDPEASTDWTKEILVLRRCVALWNMIRAADEEQLKHYIQWRIDDKGGIRVSYYGRWDPHSNYGSHHMKRLPPGQQVHECIASEAQRPELLRKFRPGEVIEPARAYVASLVDERLRDGVRARMLAEPSGRTGAGSSKLALHLIPRHFLAAVWLQLGEAIDADRRYERCAECKSWFQVSRGKTHKDRRYCSDLCKVDAYRRRKAEAREYAASGMSAAQIAERMDADVETVSGWIRSMRKDK